MNLFKRFVLLGSSLIVILFTMNNFIYVQSPVYIPSLYRPLGVWPPVTNSSLSPCARGAKSLQPLWRRHGHASLASWQREVKAAKFPADVVQTLKNIETHFDGSWRPHNCSSEPLAIVIPYRQRQDNLAQLLSILHPYLQQQMTDYQVFVVEQDGDIYVPFNKGKLFNVGFLTVQHLRPDISCFVLHDVDLIPEDERMLYRCVPSGPFHFGAWTDNLNYGQDNMYKTMNIFKYTAEALVGGVLAMTKEQYLTVNGFSNRFWGWGGEDDDLGYRIKNAGFPVHRQMTQGGPHTTYRYTMLNHKPRRDINAKRWEMGVKARGRGADVDGVTSLLNDQSTNSDDDYVIHLIAFRRLFTHILVDVGWNGSVRASDSSPGNGSSGESELPTSFKLPFSL